MRSEATICPICRWQNQVLLRSNTSSRPPGGSEQDPEVTEKKASSAFVFCKFAFIPAGCQQNSSFQKHVISTRQHLSSKTTQLTGKSSVITSQTIRIQRLEFWRCHTEGLFENTPALKGFQHFYVWTRLASCVHTAVAAAAAEVEGSHTENVHTPDIEEPHTHTPKTKSVFMARLGGGGASPSQLLQIVFSLPRLYPPRPPPPSPPVAAPLPRRDALSVECTKSNDATLSPALPLPKAPPAPDPTRPKLSAAFPSSVAHKVGIGCYRLNLPFIVQASGYT